MDAKFILGVVFGILYYHIHEFCWFLFFISCNEALFAF